MESLRGQNKTTGSEIAKLMNFSFKTEDEDNFWITNNLEYITADAIKEMIKDCFMIKKKKIPNGMLMMSKEMKNSKSRII